MPHVKRANEKNQPVEEVTHLFYHLHILFEFQIVQDNGDEEREHDLYRKKIQCPTESREPDDMHVQHTRLIAR